MRDLANCVISRLSILSPEKYKSSRTCENDSWRLESSLARSLARDRNENKIQGEILNERNAWMTKYPILRIKTSFTEGDTVHPLFPR